MFIKRVIQRGRSYYYLVESVRLEGKVRHHVVRYLGTAENLYLTLSSTESHVVITKQRKFYKQAAPPGPEEGEDW
jgi:hypothetical protein